VVMIVVGQCVGLVRLQLNMLVGVAGLCGGCAWLDVDCGLWIKG